MVSRCYPLVWTALTICAALVAITPNASAQNSGPWASVTRWQATFTLTGSGGGTNLVDKSTINVQFTASADLTSAAGYDQSRYLAWSGPASNASGSGKTEGFDITTPYPCPSYIWTGSAASLSAFLAPPQLGVVIDFSNNTYSIGGGGLVKATDTYIDCDGGKTTKDGLLALAPASTGDTSKSAFPFFPLPQTFQILQQTTFFNAPAVALGGQVPATWNLSFKLVPARPWVKVWMK